MTKKNLNLLINLKQLRVNQTFLMICKVKFNHLTKDRLEMIFLHLNKDYLNLLI